MCAAIQHHSITSTQKQKKAKIHVTIPKSMKPFVHISTITNTFFLYFLQASQKWISDSFAAHGEITITLEYPFPPGKCTMQD